MPIFVNIGGVWKKATAYVNISGEWKSVVPYVNIDGVWKDCRELSYYGTATPLSVARGLLAATSIGSYALFGGGSTIESVSNRPVYSTVDAYNSSLARSTPTALSVARTELAATVVGSSYALFGGGSVSGIDTRDVRSTVDAYNSSLARSTPTALSVARDRLSAASVGSYALFAGGGDYYGNALSTVDAYNTSLVRSTPTSLYKARRNFAAASTLNHALFGGGYTYNEGLDTVDAYSTSLVRSNPTVLYADRHSLAAASVGEYALFGGGRLDSYFSATVDAYNGSLVRSNPTGLSMGRGCLAATSIADKSYALFGGGLQYSGGVCSDSKIVDAYNPSLVRSVLTVLSVERDYLAATSIGEYALFGGGGQFYGTSKALDNVDVYQFK